MLLAGPAIEWLPSSYCQVCSSKGLAEIFLAVFLAFDEPWLIAYRQFRTADDDWEKLGRTLGCLFRRFTLPPSSAAQAGISEF